jgi:outer membrane protein assembly factor BamA
MWKWPLLLIFDVFLPLLIFCQFDTLERPVPVSQLDVRDLLIKNGRREELEKKSFFVVLPVIGSNPTAGFIYGAGLSFVYKSAATDKRSSTVSSNISYSTKRFANLNVKTNLFALKNRLFLNGDWRYYVITETTYGLGSSNNLSGQKLRYNQIRIHETASWKLLSNFFAGIGLHYDYYFNIIDSTAAKGDPDISYHYKYSTQHGFNPEEYTISGFSLNFLYDSRDNQVNAYTGSYVNVNYRINETAFGSTKNSTMLLTEYRSFYSLGRKKGRHVLALWLYGSFVVSGDVPYLLLPAVGFDQRQRSGRGYSFGRFRGMDMLYAESEYRFNISPRTGILGGVIFANLTSTSDKENNIELLNYIQPAYGTGLRIMLDKESRTRLEFDAAVGKGKIGFYFGIRETF